MKSFISEVVARVLEAHPNLNEVSFVFPSKRAGRFILRHLSQILEKTIFSPDIFSIEEFIEEVSELALLDKTNAIFKFYETYKKLTPEKDLESFETFYNWSQTLMQDFNEIDRFLIDNKSIFNYLASIQDLNHWSKQTEKTPLVQNYLRFWHHLADYYSDFKKQMIAEKIGYQGLQYRVASEKIENYLNTNAKHFVFIGFNALNLAEQKILQTILNNERGSVFWDIDKVFYEDPKHSASYFIRKYSQWPYFTEQKNSFQWIGNNYKNPKKIELIGVPKNIGQAKQIGTILSDIPKENLKNTAVVLGDESLILPVLNSLPENVENVNITMGIPLGKTPLGSFFELLFNIHSADSSRFYYKQVIEIIEHPAITGVLGDSSKNILTDIRQNNRVFLTINKLKELSLAQHHEIIESCFGIYTGKPLFFLEQMERLTHFLKQAENEFRNQTLFQFNKLFKKLILLLATETPIKTVKTLYRIYQSSLNSETLDFQGSPFDGLQLMGMLETRVLDFETVIITSVNEGILPTGKTGNSFIPYDLKKEYGLPTYTEKDAIYAYHFYRLLQRAKNVFLLYNSVPGDMNGGEKSRFILQLQTEKQANHVLTERTIVPQVPSIANPLKTLVKTPEILEKIKILSAHGLSPSALLTYIRNPMDFYYRYILDIKDIEEVEETIAANTLGTVVHDSLEELFLQNEGLPYSLTENHLKGMLQNYESVVDSHYRKQYRTDGELFGKNLISYEVAKRYVYNFLRSEQKFIRETGVEIVALEKPMKAEIPIEKELGFPVFLKGKSDRIDRVHDTVRIIDYKTGKVVPAELRVDDWDELVLDYKYAKAFQVLCYSYLYFANSECATCEAGIISFKNLKEGFMGFSGKKEDTDKKRFEGIDSQIMELFQVQLKKLLLEIADPEIPFTEKEIQKYA
ncbi:MAG TPA: PD-(D/E)XK nuclease family protein [Flavobacteriaceae bacterium]|nr:PD-(D/E)XK nuclease family protein [Flavobacteriaceae bacterium]